jgi:23S rRNA pseudouridine2605 synthase|uniref:pseudouridine synthase n=1 Tax=Amniculibacterium aquaticum TaxID=2479858 RepID=UPI000F5A2B53|nr:MULTISPECIES: pseudouridine synthase [Amniculibacterium]
MSEDRNSSGRPKRPRIQSNSGSGNSFPSKKTGRSFDGPKSYDKRGGDSERGSYNKSSNFGNSRGGGRSFEGREGYDRSDRNSDSSSYKKPSFGNTRGGERSFDGNNSYKKPGGFGNSRGGGRSFDSRDKYEKGDLKYGNKKPYNKFGNDEDRTKNFVQKRKLQKIEKDIHKDTIRLNKYLANAGICSRREADELIKQGLVLVNGEVITEMGHQVQKNDKVVFDGQNISPEKSVYVLLNKPKGYISTTKDDKARKTVMDLVANASPYRLFPVGRLDRSTTGVILLTNDGHLTKKLTHPSFEMKKIYHVTLDKKLSSDDMQAIIDGIRLEEGVATVDKISFIEGKPKNEVGVEIHIGWNRVIRRIFQRLGYEVEALDRVMFAGLTKKNIKRGHWRILDELEVNNLRML